MQNKKANPSLGRPVLWLAKGAKPPNRYCSKNRCASSAAMQPVPALVMA